MSHSYVFTSIRGKQAGREYFVAMCPLKLIPKIFLFDEIELRPEIRAQRILNKARVPEIARYLAENPKDYVLSSLTASIDGEVVFHPINDAGKTADIGNLSIPMSARFLLNDGQHRQAAIAEALKLRPEIGDETISVVFFLDTGLRRSQQMFADLNRHAVRPTQSIGILYDHRDGMSKLARDVIDRVAVFRDMVEKEKTSISNRSYKLFTLSGIYQANLVLLQKKGKKVLISDADLKYVCDFWETVSSTIPEWKLAQQRKISAAELREDRVHAHAIALHALALVGVDLVRANPTDWKAQLKRLAKVDWSRSNKGLWEGRALMNGRVSKSQVNVHRTANYFKQIIGLSLTTQDKKFENQFPVRKQVRMSRAQPEANA